MDKCLGVRTFSMKEKTFPCRTWALPCPKARSAVHSAFSSSAQFIHKNGQTGSVQGYCRYQKLLSGVLFSIPNPVNSCNEIILNVCCSLSFDMA